MLINDVLVKKYFYLICLLFGKDVICEYIFYYGLLLLSRYFFYGNRLKKLKIN